MRGGARPPPALRPAGDNGTLTISAAIDASGVYGIDDSAALIVSVPLSPAGVARPLPALSPAERPQASAP